MALQRSGQSAAMMLAVRAPQSKPARIGLLIWSASISATMSSASGRRLAVADGVVGQESRRPVAAEVRHDHAVAARRQERSDVDEAVDVVRPAVQEDRDGPAGRTCLGVGDVERSGVDVP